MEYPYIGKTKLGSVVIFYEEYTGRVIEHIGNMPEGQVDDDWCENQFTNITREYLEGKCVKIESPEHSEFVQKLAFNAGFKWSASGRELKYQNSKFLSFHKCGLIGFADYSPEKAAALEETTIPLPPKAESEPKEWPQVGDSVTWGKGADNAEIKALDDYSAWVKNIHGNYYTVDINKLRKPKTEAEILRDDLISVMDNSTTAFTYAEHIAKHLIDNYNITKKPQ